VTHKAAAHGDATASHLYCGSLLLFVATVVPPFVFPPCLPLSPSFPCVISRFCHVPSFSHFGTLLPHLSFLPFPLCVTQTSVQQLSVCWNDAFRRIFHYKRFESVMWLQDAFGVMDINHVYDLYRWNLL